MANSDTTRAKPATPSTFATRAAERAARRARGEVEPVRQPGLSRRAGIDAAQPEIVVNRVVA